MFSRIWRYYNHPYRRWLLPVSGGVGVYFYLLWGKYHPLARLLAGPQRWGLQETVDWLLAALFYGPLWAFLFWFFFFFLLVAFWLFFFAQFTLPVSTWEGRGAIFVRLLYYIAGWHGPAIFIQDGQKIESKAEKLRRGPGVIVLDSASAAVLQTEGGFTRAVGPGVVFTSSGETAHDGATVDLRKRSASLGPHGDEDPFAPQGEDETDEMYSQRMARRWETSAKTRDGTEVVARLVVVFALDKRPDDLSEEAWAKGRFQTRFFGHQVSVWRAITHRPIDAAQAAKGTAKTPDEHLLRWDWLPARLAADLWREYLQRFRLSTLFQPSPDGSPMLDFIAAAIRERLTQPQYRELGLDGERTGEVLPSREYALLQERGIRVIAVALPAVFLPPEVEQQLVSRWTANWLVRARKERELVEHRRSLAQKQGEKAAATQWAAVAEQVCRDAGDLSPLACLDRLMAALTRTIQQDPALYLAHKSEFDALDMLWAWVHNHRIESGELLRSAPSHEEPGGDGPRPAEPSREAGEDHA